MPGSANGRVTNLEDASSMNIIDDPVVPFDVNREDEREPRIARNIITIRDDFLPNRDNIAYFVTVKNQHLCTGAIKLSVQDRLPRYRTWFWGRLR